MERAAKNGGPTGFGIEYKLRKIWCRSIVGRSSPGKVHQNPSVWKYMRALAELGSGIRRSGDIAHILSVKTASVAPTRSSLIKKGMIYSPSHGDTAFTFPLFDQYMKRAM